MGERKAPSAGRTHRLSQRAERKKKVSYDRKGQKGGEGGPR